MNDLDLFESFCDNFLVQPSIKLHSSTFTLGMWESLCLQVASLGKKSVSEAVFSNESTMGKMIRQDNKND